MIFSSCDNLQCDVVDCLCVDVYEIIDIHISYDVIYRPAPRHYHADLFQQFAEIEDGRTPENKSVRFRYSEKEFKGYSWRGYGVFSYFQVISGYTPPSKFFYPSHDAYFPCLVT